MSLLAELREAVGPEQLLTDPAVTASYGTDWTRRFTGRPLAVVRPADTGQVAAVVSACRRAGVPLVPQGGNTGLVGGGVPRGDDRMVVLSTRRLTALGDVDVASRQVTAGAGVTLAALQAAAARHGLGYGVDLAARDSATVGGTIATNAGGIRVVAYGPTRAQLLGVEAVLADGSVVSRLGGLVKDSTGYDLAGLLCGSEGTLGVVTAARLRLHPAPGPSLVVLAGMPSVAAAQRLLPGTGLLAAELMSRQTLSAVTTATGLPDPLRRTHPYYLLLEAPPEVLERLELPADTATGPGVWGYRERATEAIATRGVAHKLDVTVPPAALPEFCDRVERAVAPYQVFLFGHLAEGNVHVNVIGPAPDDMTVDTRVLRLVAELGGSISAEHGIGVAKKDYLALSRSPAEIRAMTAIKHAWDPTGVLNPGVLLG